LITRTLIRDKRFPLAAGTGSDAVHCSPVYSYAITILEDDSGISGSGFTFTLGKGNDLVCRTARLLADKLVGRDIEELMGNFGNVFNQLSNEPQLRWLGPHKGVVHLALSAVTNACYDLWAKKRGVPLWKLLIDLSPEQIVNSLDLSYLEELMTREDAIGLLQRQENTKSQRMQILKDGYPGYDSSIGWFNYMDENIKENCKRAMDEGFTAMKLKVGASDPMRDLRRANIVREVVGSEIKIMLDANQQWTLPQALKICAALQPMNPFWIEEPTHPDDIFAHMEIASQIAPVNLAIGEHVPNRVAFKNYLQSKSIGYLQVDALRVGRVSEFITISLLSKIFGIPVVPHVGDMGQLHQHLVLFNHICIGHDVVFLEVAPHLNRHFIFPATIKNAVYTTPQDIGCSCELK
jgi:L-fuconate dehydratase